MRALARLDIWLLRSPGLEGIPHIRKFESHCWLPCVLPRPLTTPSAPLMWRKSGGDKGWEEEGEEVGKGSPFQGETCLWNLQPPLE